MLNFTYLNENQPHRFITCKSILTSVVLSDKRIMKDSETYVILLLSTLDRNDVTAFVCCALQRVSGLENLQVQMNQIKANVGVGNIYSGQPDYRNDNGLDTGLGSWDDPTPHTSSSKNPNSSADQYPSTSRNDGKDTNTQMGTIPESGDTSRKTPVSPSKGGKTKSPANSRTVTPSKSRNVTPSQSRNNTPTQPSRNVTPNTGRNKKSPTPSTGKTGNNTARDGDQTNRQDGNKTPKGGNDTARDGNQTDRDGNQPISSLADV